MKTLLARKTSSSPVATDGTGPVWEAWSRAGRSQPKEPAGATDEASWALCLKRRAVAGLTVAIGVPILACWTLLIVVAALCGTAMRYLIEGGDKLLNRRAFD